MWSLIAPFVTHYYAAYGLLWVALVSGLGGSHESAGEVFAAVEARPYSVGVVYPAFVALCVFALAPALGAVCVI